MTWRNAYKRVRVLKRRKQPLILSCLLVLGAGIILYANLMSNKRITIDPTAYSPLLHLIAQAESSDNYNAYFGNAGNTTVDFTAMSVAEVLAWQDEFVRQGNPSSAVGRYQIIRPTLAGLVNQLRIDSTQKFDNSLQDRMAVALLERRGADAYINDEMTREAFAANLAKEWAALPKIVGDKPHESYYAGDGLNKSRVAVHEILAVIARIDA